MDLANIPEIACERILMFAAEKEYLDFFHKQEGEQRERSFYIGKWMEILHKFGQICPKWKDTIFRSKMLFEHDIEENEEREPGGLNRDYPEKWDSVHSLDFRTGRVKIYKGKWTLNLQYCDPLSNENHVGLSMVRDGYMSLAKHMRLELSLPHSPTDDEILDELLNFADTCSIESYEVIFKKDHMLMENDKTKLRKLVEMLEKSKNVTCVDVNLDLGTDDSRNQSAYEHIMEVLQVETIKHAKFEFNSTVFALIPLPYWSKLNLDIIERCFSNKKMGQVEQIEIVFNKNWSPTGVWYYGNVHTKTFKYENLNKANRPDFIRKFLGGQKQNYQTYITHIFQNSKESTKLKTKDTLTCYNSYRKNLTFSTLYTVSVLIYSTFIEERQHVENLKTLLPIAA